MLGRAIVKPAKRQRSILSRAKRSWLQAVGRDLAARAWPSGVRRGVMTVEVESSALLAELSGFRKKSILRAIAAQGPGCGVRDIKFVLAEKTR